MNGTEKNWEMKMYQKWTNFRSWMSLDLSRLMTGMFQTSLDLFNFDDMN